MNNIITPKISIIIPCYNSSSYIKECLDSIKEQSFTDFEVIIVNDGSTDDSEEIIQKNIQNDPRFRLINQVNQGVSSARNLGLELSLAETICFIDIDDKISSDYLYVLYEEYKLKKNHIDLFQIPYIKIFPNNCINKVTTPLDVSLENIIDHTYLCYYVWGKLYKRDIITKNNINFSYEIKTGEDFLFNLQYLILSNGKYSIASCEEYYLYRVTNNSLCRKITKESLAYRPKAALAIYNYLKSINILDSESLYKIYMGYAFLGNLRFTLRKREYLLAIKSLSYLNKDLIKFKMIHKMKCSISSKLVMYVSFLLIPR